MPFKAKDPISLTAWYHDVLGLPLEAWGGPALRNDAPEHPSVIWNAFPASTSYFAPSTSDFMINYAVDEMDAVLAPVSTKGVVILSRKDDPSDRSA